MNKVASSSRLLSHAAFAPLRFAFTQPLLSTMWTNLGIAGIGFLSGMVAARTLGPSLRGQLLATQIWPHFLASLALLGTPDALVFLSAREPKNAGSFLASAVALTSISSAVVVCVGFFLLPVLLHAQSAETVRTAQMYLLVVPLYIGVGLLYQPLRGIGQLTLWNMLRIVTPIAWLLTLVGCSMTSHVNPRTVCYSYLVALGFVGVAIAVTVRRRVPGPYHVSPRNWSPLLGYGLPCVLTFITLTFNLRLDQILMAGLFPSAALGLYVAATAWSGISNPLISAFGTQLLPRLAGTAGTLERNATFSRAVRRAGVIAAISAGLVAAATPAALPLIFGKAFSPAVPCGIVLAIASGMQSVNMVMEEGIRGLGNPRLVLFTELAGMAMLFATLPLFMRHFGILGAAVSSLMVYSTVTVVLLATSCRLLRTSIVVLLKPQRDDLMSWPRAAVTSLEVLPTVSSH